MPLARGWIARGSEPPTRVGGLEAEPKTTDTGWCQSKSLVFRPCARAQGSVLYAGSTLWAPLPALLGEQVQFFGAGGHRGDTVVDVVVELDAEQFGAGGDVVATHRGGE